MCRRTLWRKDAGGTVRYPGRKTEQPEVCNIHSRIQPPQASHVDRRRALAFPLVVLLIMPHAVGNVIFISSRQTTEGRAPSLVVSSGYAVCFNDIAMLRALSWQIVADFLVLAVAFYALLRWARTARAMRIALGVVGLHALALLARRLDLVVTSWVMDAAAILAVLVLLLIFQPELRRAFMRMDSALKRWPRPAKAGDQTSRAIASSSFALAQLIWAPY